MSKNITAQQLQDLKSPYLHFEFGSLQSSALRPLPPEHYQKGHLTFVSDSESFRKVVASGAPLIIALKKALNKEAPATTAVFSTPSISAALATILPLFDRKLEKFGKASHPSAVVDPTAQVHPSAILGPYSVIGAGSVVGANTRLGPHTVVEAFAKVGENCILHSQVVIGAECEIGNRCEIHSGTVIGSDGFGYIQSPDGKQNKIAQIGKVILEDDVELGAQCAIDRATFFETRIKHGTKLDNFCHIAHNNTIGADCALAGGFMTSGSVIIGDRCMTGGGVHVSGHLHITDGVTMAGRTGVTKDITEPGMYIGFPHQPYREGAKVLTSFAALPEMRKQLNEVRKKLGLKNDK
jgi:UDP-3-O-[3-hydroxymyristoyl] glucosamine N-acyltransferase